jgi:hypothetical protein
MRLSVVVLAVVGIAAAVSERKTMAIGSAVGVVLCIAALHALESWRLRGYRGR